MDQYFSDYCKHYNLPSVNFEAGYLDHFHKIACKTSPGNKVMVDLHYGSSQSVFENARKVCDVEYIPDGESSATRIESELRSNKKVLVNLFVYDPSSAASKLGVKGIARYHNITVGVDEQGLYIFDVNEHQGLLSTSFTSISEIGKIGDAVLFTVKR